MDNKGYIKLHRDILKWEWYDDSKTFGIFIHCLLKANHKDKKWRGITVKRGSFITSYGKLASELGITVRSVRTAITKLEATGELTRSSSSQNTVLKVNNYNQYQDFDTRNDKPTTNERQTNDKPTTTTKNDNNDKNDKKKIDSPEVESWWNSLPYNLIKIQVMSDRRKKSLNARVKEIGGDIEVFKQQVEKAISESDLLQGKKTDWVCSFDFVLQKSSFIKMIEGNYRGSKRNNLNDLTEGNF